MKHALKQPAICASLTSWCEATSSRSVIAMLMAVLVICFAQPACAAAPKQAIDPEPEQALQDQPAEDEPGERQPQNGDVFPGIHIDFENKVVDVSARVCLNHGLLEVIACTPDSREHESIVVVDAVPMHIHAALLLIGANNGNPAMARPANEEQTRWVHVPPSGDPIAVSLLIVSENGEPVEQPIATFIKRAEQAPFEEGDPDAPEGEGAAEGEDGGDQRAPSADPAEVFASFVFAGSQVVEDDNGDSHYLADYNGNVISISTFGDETICLPWIQSRENGDLEWEANGDTLPAVGTQVQLRLRLIQPQDDGANE